ncbi:UvrD-helicase domain-containing protein [Sorangium sp. So ce1335]|uniref:UvrD-helicase domain-containing protein n=1 Tax=Sorangium sp. So ce1335 TaxID=3133335 RepID=UPI003F5E34C8
MQVAIAREYFPAYARLPRKVQRKADEFLRKFTADPRQPSIHYEPIRGARDPQLRSARIGDDYRAIVREPEAGDVFLLLWIDHHDEAYRWAASKRTEVHPATGTLQLFDEAAAARALTSPDSSDGGDRATGTAEPQHKGRTREKSGDEGQGLFAAFTDDDLFHGGVPRVLIPAVRAVTTEAELEQLLPHLPADAAEVLTGLAAGFTLNALLEELLGRPALPAQVEKPVDPGDVVAALGRPSTQQQFRLVDEEFNLDAALANPLDVWRVYLHPKQRAIARARTKGPMRVTGGAGTGKTVVALHRAAFLVREVFTKPDERVLFTTFTVNLAHDVRRQLEKLLEPRELARIDVKNLDAWASEYLRSRGEPVRLATTEAQEEAWTRVLDVYAVDGYSAEFCKTEWRDVIQAQDLREDEAYVRAVRLHRGLPLGRRERRQLWPLFQAYRQELSASGILEPVEILRRARQRIEADGASPPYRAVVVDETQDLSAEALRLVRAIAGQEHPDDLFLVGDAHQRIYGRPVSLGSVGINVRGRRSQELRLNYRTTAAICRWSLGALGAEEMDDLDDGIASRRGYVSLREGQPPLVQCFEYPADEVRFVVDEVKRMLAAGTPPEGICIAARRMFALRDRFLDALTREGIPADLLEREEPRHPSVRLATMHRIKGLEFPVVFVVGVNDDEVPYRSPALTSSDPVVAHQTELAERCLLYVAASRARDALYVSASGAPSPYLKAMGAPARRPGTSEGTAPEPSPGPQVQLMPASQFDGAGEAVSPVVLEATDPPLDSLVLPSRLLTWAAKNGITTLGQLARIPPSKLLAEPNLGRTTLAQTRAVLETLLGKNWEAASAEHSRTDLTSSPETSGPGGATPPTRWDELRIALPDTLRTVCIDEVDFPTRVRSYAEREGLKTLADLAQRSEAELDAATNLGRRSVRLIFEAVRGHLERMEARHQLLAAGLLESWKALLQEQDSVPRMVLTLRAGLGGRAEKLHAIGEILGVSRERIRQIESRVLGELARERAWLSEARRRIDLALRDGAISLEALAADPWWGAIVARPEALDYFGERILEGAARVVEFEERLYLARCPQEALDKAWNDLRRSAGQVALPAEITAFRDLLAPLRLRIGSVLCDVLWEQLVGLLHVEEAADGRRVTGFGGTHAAAILALLRASPTPVHIDELWTRLGRCHIPDEVLFFGRGLVGLERHFPDFGVWMDRLVPAAIRIMEREAPERQWLASELLEELREELDIPEWLTQWHLGSLLRRSDRVRYLGRLRVALPVAPEGQGRLLFHDELVRILRERGAPMSREELATALRRKTSVNELTLTQCLARPQFLKCGEGRVGLIDRDLPGGAEALAEAVEHAAALLERRQRGLGSAQLLVELTRLSPAHAHWNAEMCLSVLRGDSRFRLSQAGAVGLSSWESVRVPTRTELLQQCLEEAGGRVSIDAVQRRIEAYYGEMPERASLGSMAVRWGASLQGDWVVRDVTGACGGNGGD